MFFKTPERARSSLEDWTLGSSQHEGERGFPGVTSPRGNNQCLMLSSWRQNTRVLIFAFMKMHSFGACPGSNDETTHQLRSSAGAGPLFCREAKKLRPLPPASLSLCSLIKSQILGPENSMPYLYFQQKLRSFHGRQTRHSLQLRKYKLQPCPRLTKITLYSHHVPDTVPCKTFRSSISAASLHVCI